MHDEKPIEWTEPREPKLVQLPPWQMRLAVSVRPALAEQGATYRTATVADLRLACNAAGLSLCSEERDCDEGCTSTEQGGVTCDIALSSSKDIYAQQNAQIERLRSERDEGTEIVAEMKETQKQHHATIYDFNCEASRARERIRHLESALEQSEAARAELGDRLAGAASYGVWSARCVALINDAPECEDAMDYVIEAVELAGAMNGEDSRQHKPC